MLSNNGSFEPFRIELFVKINDYLDSVSLYFWAITNRYFSQFLIDPRYDQLWDYQLAEHFPPFPIEGTEDLIKSVSAVTTAHGYPFFKQACFDYYKALSNKDLLETRDSKGLTFFSLIKRHKRIQTYIAHHIYDNDPKVSMPDLLSYAIQLDQDDDKFKKLLEGKKIDSIKINNQTLLTKAIQYDSINTLKLLLKLLSIDLNPPNIDSIKINNQTLLIKAIQYDSINTVKLLLELGAAPDPLGNELSFSRSPLCLASKKGHSEIVDLLLPHIKASAVCLDVAAYLASSKGHLNILQCLVKHGANINGHENYPTLYTAMHHGNILIVDYLLKQGADRTIKNRRGHPLLFGAALKNHLKAIKVFVAYHEKNKLPLDIDEKDKSGKSTLFIAAQKGHTEICQFLLSHGAKQMPNQVDETPLHVAAYGGHSEVIKILCTANPKPNCNDRSPLYTPLYIACKKGWLETARMLINHQASVNLGTTDGCITPLYVAAQKGHNKIVGLLIEHGANVTLCNKNNGYSPLHIACSNTHYLALPIITSLIKAGASSLVTCSEGKKPSQYARDEGIKNILLLLEKIECGLTNLVNEKTKFIINKELINLKTSDFVKDHANEFINPQISHCINFLNRTFTSFGYAVVLYALFSSLKPDITFSYSGLHNQMRNQMEKFTDCIIDAFEYETKFAVEYALKSIISASISGKTSGKILFEMLHEVVIDEIIKILNHSNRFLINTDELWSDSFQKIILCLNLYEVKIKQQAAQLIEQDDHMIEINLPPPNEPIIRMNKPF